MFIGTVLYRKLACARHNLRNFTSEWYTCVFIGTVLHRKTAYARHSLRNRTSEWYMCVFIGTVLHIKTAYARHNLQNLTSEWYMCSLALSSTRMSHRSACPCARSRHSKSARIVSCTRSTVRVMGCKEAAMVRRGKAATQLAICAPVCRCGEGGFC